jgi:enamine deaminase RidA (YjgF/YER057c/UK114 family)
MMDVAKVHGKFFGKILPASTGVEVGALIDDKLLVEIEASAIISQSS